MSWVAVDSGRPEGQSDELVGYVTTAIIPARESEVDLDPVNYLKHSMIYNNIICTSLLELETLCSVFRSFTT